MTSTRVGGTSALRITSTITTVTCKRIIRHNHRQWRNLLTGCVTDDGCRSEEHTSELQSQSNLVCRLLLEKKKKFTLLQHVANSSIFDCDLGINHHSFGLHSLSSFVLHLLGRSIGCDIQLRPLPVPSSMRL